MAKGRDNDDRWSKHHASMLFRLWCQQTTWYDTTQQNQQFASVCQKMKDEGIIVYTVTFTSGINNTTKDYYRECATDETKYYDAPARLIWSKPLSISAFQFNFAGIYQNSLVAFQKQYRLIFIVRQPDVRSVWSKFQVFNHLSDCCVNFILDLSISYI